MKGEDANSKALVAARDVQYLTAQSHLEQLVKKEAQTFQPLVLTAVEPACISAGLRKEAVDWLLELVVVLDGFPETVSLAVVIFDKVLNDCKVQIAPKDVWCLALTCYYVALKRTEERKAVPSLVDLVSMSRVNCSARDVRKLEPKVTAKLGWDLNPVKPLDYVQLYLSLLLLECPEVLEDTGISRESYHEFLTKTVCRCQAYPLASYYKPSVITLALISLDLELFRTDSFHLMVKLQKATGYVHQISVKELVYCREEISSVILGNKVQRMGPLTDALKHEWVDRVINVLCGGSDLPIPACPPLPRIRPSAAKPTATTLVIARRVAARKVREEELQHASAAATAIAIATIAVSDFDDEGRVDSYSLDPFSWQDIRKSDSNGNVLVRGDYSNDGLPAQSVKA